MRRLRLWWRLVSLTPRLLAAARRKDFATVGEIVSEVEAIHRDLGHECNAGHILPQHQRPQ